MRVARNALGDNSETVVLHRRRPADTTEQTLLDTLLELDHSNTGRGLYSMDRVMLDDVLYHRVERCNLQW